MKTLASGRRCLVELLDTYCRVPKLNEMAHFYVTLPCDSSLSFFPKNTVAQYNTKLSERIRLDGDYEVALVDFIYPWSFQNVRNTKSNRLVMSLQRNDYNRMVAVFQYAFEDAYYENETEFATTVTEKINTQLRSIPELRDIIIEFTFDKTTRKLTMYLELEDMTLTLSDALLTKLGFCRQRPYPSGSYQSTDTFDLNAGQRLMYIYCDIASHVLLGNTKSPLLRICNARGEYGRTIRDTFDRPFYVPVSRREFDTISIDIRDELGQPMPFDFGKSVATLHFRRINNLLTS